MKQTVHLWTLRNSLASAKKWFTLIELLVSVSILAALSVVAYTSLSGHIKTVNNATRVSTIDSMQLSLSDYFQTKKILPEPNSNYIAYDERGTYAHSLSGAYGVSGHVTADFLPAGYVNFGLSDPENGQFYAYGKTLDPRTPTFDLAATLYDDSTGGYKAYVKGTYQGQKLASLIRSYSSSNFISQNSTEELPYNPYERKINAYISSLSGTLSIKYSGGIVRALTGTIDAPFSFTGELASGDTIVVATGSTVLLHISDGSELSLGSATSQTELELTSLTYNPDNKFATKVRLFLKSGETWTEAPHLRAEADSQSDFSIQTDSAVAAVRGTVFGISKTPTGTTSIGLKVGKLQVDRLDAGGNTTPFTSGFNVGATNGFVLSGSRSYMTVSEGGTPIKLDGITNSVGSETSTGTLSPTDIGNKIYHPPFSFGYRPVADKITFADINAPTQQGILTILYNNPGADSYELYFGSGISDPNLVLKKPDLLNPNQTGTLSGTGPITITGSFAYVPESMKIWTYSLRVCLHGICSAPDIQHLAGNTFAYGPFHAWGETVQKPLTTLSPTCPSVPSLSSFWNVSCLTGANSGLVAYAPYDNIGDMQLYTSGAVLPYGTWGDIIFSWATGGTWVIVGTWSYLRYNLSSLNLGNNFSIEMSVRGSALKRSGDYYLFNTVLGFHNEIYLQLNAWNLNLWNWIGTSFVQNATIPSSELSFLEGDKFYKIIARFNGVNWTLQIPEKALSVSGSGILNTWTNYFIGSIKEGFSYQWNDIINSVKIYKQ